jgi:DNA-binding response OmpR family regulator
MKVLIAEDEPEIWKPYKIALESRKHKVVIAEDGEECLREYKKELSRKQKANSITLSRKQSILS